MYLNLFHFYPLFTVLTAFHRMHTQISTYQKTHPYDTLINKGNSTSAVWLIYWIQKFGYISDYIWMGFISCPYEGILSLRATCAPSYRCAQSLTSLFCSITGILVVPPSHTSKMKHGHFIVVDASLWNRLPKKPLMYHWQVVILMKLKWSGYYYDYLCVSILLLKLHIKRYQSCCCWRRPTSARAFQLFEVGEVLRQRNYLLNHNQQRRLFSLAVFKIKCLSYTMHLLP